MPTVHDATRVNAYSGFFDPLTECKPKPLDPIARFERRESLKKEKGVTYEHFECPPIEPAEAEFRHHRWAAKREKVAVAIAAGGTSPRAIEAFNNCGAYCRVLHSKTDDRYRIAGSYCHNRHCEPCMRAKANNIVRNLLEQLHTRKNAKFRFVTLTLCHSDTPLIDQMKRLYASFSKLRKSTLWKASQSGGAAMMEVKLSKKDGMWHPHLHIVCEGNWIDVRDLSRAWKKITGDSSVVDIRPLKNDRDAANYVAKYVTKSTDDSVWLNADRSQEWICASRGTRSCLTFGNWRGVGLTRKPKDPGDWKFVGMLTHLLCQARAGDKHAVRVCQQIRSKGHVESDIGRQPGEDETTRYGDGEGG